MTDELQPLHALRAVQALYEQEIAPCTRSPEWKTGARAAIWRLHELPWQRSAWPSGTCQDDAYWAGYHVGMALAREQLKPAVQGQAA